MALVVKDYGSGALGDVSSVTSTINSYARVTAVTTNSITINTSTQVTGTATFTVGAKILLHVSATTSSSYKTYLGCWMLANITATSSGTLTLDADPTTCIPSANLAQYYVQAIAVAQYKNLTLNSGTTVTPPVYNATNYVGGIVALMCSDTLTFSGGHISLTDRGIPVASKDLRPLVAQEAIELVNSSPYIMTGTTVANLIGLDGVPYSGWENSDTKDHMLLNAGDGAAFIVAKTMICSTSSRIGNTATRGYQFCRGAQDSVAYNENIPTNVTNVGGSTILVAAETIQNFTPYILAKYRSSSSTAGQGLCRCYIASETKLRNDEGLYAYDCISNPERIITKMNIKNFGNGSFGDMTNVTKQLNNYATITAASSNKVTYTGKTTAGLAPIAKDALVMIHFSHKSTSYIENSGRFIVANVLSDSGTVLTLDKNVPNIDASDYAAQVVSIPQAKNFTLSTTNSATPSFNGATGGIFAVAVNDTCDVSNGKINVENKGGGTAYSREGLAVIGNAQDSDKLPIGAGHGSVFILAQNLVMNNATRIGATHNGAAFGGTPGKPDLITGYLGAMTLSKSVAVSGYTDWQIQLANFKDRNSGKTCPSGANYGTGKNNYDASDGRGGYGSNALNTGFWKDSTSPQKQGAHVMIIAKKITGFNQRAISTGGSGLGGAGYGGYGRTFWNDPTDSDHYIYQIGGYNGGAFQAYMAGGSSGWAFVYCNEVVNQDTTGTVLAN